MYWFLFIFVAILSASNGAIDIGKYLKICNRNSVDLNDCMADAVREGIAAMAGGIEELDLPSLDPFLQKELKVEYKNNQIAVKMLAKDVYVQGLTGAKVHDARVRADDDRLHIEVDLSAPLINIWGGYTGEGQYNALKIKAYGEFNATMNDLVFTWKLDGVTKKNGSDTFIRITSFYMRPDVGNMETQLINHNPETKDLTDLGTRFTNANWRVLYRELLPFAQTNWDKIGTQISNKIFLNVPYNKIMPIST